MLLPPSNTELEVKVRLEGTFCFLTTDSFGTHVMFYND